MKKHTLMVGFLISLLVLPGIVLAQKHNDHAWIGITIEWTREGVAITGIIAESPAETAGLEIGDTILSIDGTDIQGIGQLLSAVYQAQPGDTMTFSVQRGEEILEIEVTLGSLPEGVISIEKRGPPVLDQGTWPNQRILLGIQYRVLSEEEATDLGIDQPTGAIVIRVLPGTAADDAGLQTDDVILAVDSQQITAENSLQTIIATYKSGDTVTLKIQRDGAIQEIEATLAAPPPPPPIRDRRFGEKSPRNQFGHPITIWMDMFLEEIDLESLPEEGTVTVECSDGDENVVLTLQFEITEDGAVSNLSVPGIGFQSLIELNPDDLDCTVTVEAEKESGNAVEEKAVEESEEEADE